MYTFKPTKDNTILKSGNMTTSKSQKQNIRQYLVSCSYTDATSIYSIANVTS